MCISNMQRGVFTSPFVKFVAKKIVFYAIVTFIAITFVFLIPRLMPGNPIDRMIPRGTSSPIMDYGKLRQILMSYYGFDKPLFDQYVMFWGNLLRGDLSISLTVQPLKPVAQIIAWKLPFTLALVIPVLLISFFLGNWIGAKAAYMGGKRSELLYFFSVFTNRLPSFWFGMVLILIFARTLAIFPSYGWSSIVPPNWSSLNFLRDVLWHYSLPFITLLIVYLGGWATGMRSMLIHEMDSGYVRYSDQLGFKKKKSMSYAQRNAILPQFTGLNLYLAALVGETTVIEVVFGWPGLGNLMYQGVMGGPDYPVIFGAFLFTMIIVIFGNFLIDILYGFLDPRIRIGQG